MQKSFKKDDQVRLTDEAIENYGPEWEGQTLKVTHVATRYMREQKPGYHPGFDPTSDSALYDLETLSGDKVPLSFYDWELEDAN